MKKTLVLLFWICSFAFLPTKANAQQIKALREMYGSNSPRLTDPVEQEYVLHRCSALNYAFNAHFKADFLRFKDERGLKSGKLAEQFEGRANGYLDRAMSLSGKTGATVESTTRRINQFMKFYSDEIQRNRDMHNQMFVGLVDEDMQVCK